MYQYCCVSCGRELRQEDAVVSLANLVFDGAPDSELETMPLYISKSALEGLVARTNANGYQYLTLEEVVRIAYGEENRRYLKKPAESAEKALSLYRASLQRAAEAEEDRDRRVQQRRRAAQEAERAERREAEEQAAQQETPSGAGGSSLFDTLVAMGLDQSAAQQEAPVEESAAPELEIVDTEPAVESKVILPGFSDLQSVQLQENFPNGVCICSVLADRQYGYAYKLPGRAEGAAKGWYCSDADCHAPLLKYAFEYPQILIGLVGFQTIGKSCLIAAMVSDLLRQGGILTIPQNWSERYRQELTQYQNGQTLTKTTAEGTNRYNPTVLLHKTLFTFIDVSGEAIHDENTQEFHPNNVIRNFKSILRCNSYIFCVTAEELARDWTNRTADTFNAFLRFIDRRTPVMLAMTKEDEDQTQDRSASNAGAPYNADRYLRALKREYRRAGKYTGLLEMMGSRNYLTPVTCSAYGFSPSRPEDNGARREPSPRNIDLILQWIHMVHGMERFSNELDPVDASGLERIKAHLNEADCLAIATLFCNPNRLDRERYLLINGGFQDKLKLKRMLEQLKKGAFTEAYLIGDASEREHG